MGRYTNPVSSLVKICTLWGYFRSVSAVDVTCRCFCSCFVDLKLQYSWGDVGSVPLPLLCSLNMVLPCYCFCCVFCCCGNLRERKMEVWMRAGSCFSQFWLRVGDDIDVFHSPSPPRCVQCRWKEEGQLLLPAQWAEFTLNKGKKREVGAVPV